MILLSQIGSILAQDIDPVNINMTTTAGIVAVSFVLTEIVKRLVKTTTPFFGRVPIIFVPIVFCAGLTVLANKVMKHDNGVPFLKGNIWVLLGNAVMLASSSSGLYTWLRNGSVTTGQSIPLGKENTGEDHIMKPNPLIFLALLISGFFFIGGCVTSEQYKVGAHALGTDLGKNAQRYVNKDTSLDPTTKATRQVQVQAFLGTLSDLKSISRPAVVNAWNAVEAWYLSYVNGDTKLDPMEKDLRNESVQRFDKLGTDDAKRPFALFGK